MKNVFIPSDFSEQSLSLISNFRKQYKTQQFNIILFHTLVMPESITDLLPVFKCNQEILKSAKDFTNECSVLEESSFGQICSIQPTLIYGTSATVFSRYLKANAIDLIVWHSGYRQKKLNRYSYDPHELILNCGIQVIDMNMQLFSCNESQQLVKKLNFSAN